MIGNQDMLPDLEIHPLTVNRWPDFEEYVVAEALRVRTHKGWIESESRRLS